MILLFHDICVPRVQLEPRWPHFIPVPMLSKILEGCGGLWIPILIFGGAGFVYGQVLGTEVTGG